MTHETLEAQMRIISDDYLAAMVFQSFLRRGQWLATMYDTSSGVPFAFDTIGPFGAWKEAIVAAEEWVRKYPRRPREDHR